MSGWTFSINPPPNAKCYFCKRPLDPNPIAFKASKKWKSPTLYAHRSCHLLSLSPRPRLSSTGEEIK